MKKLLGISVVAMLAVSPMMANATPVPADLAEPATATAQAPAASTDNDPKYAPVTVAQADQSHIASTAYVKGAYNAAIAAVNKVYDTATNAADTALTSAGGNGIAWNGTSKKLDVDLATESGLKIGTGDDAGKLMVDAGDGLAISATDGSLEVDLASNMGLTVNANHKLEAVVNTATMKVDASGIGIKDSGVDAAQIKDGAVTASKLASGVIQSSVRSNLSDDTTIASEKAVASEIASVKSGTLSTINASTVSIFTTWGSDDGTVNGATSTVNVAAPLTFQQGS